jgi:maltose O-acetyltransferase
MKQKMLAGERYQPSDPELQADQGAARAWMVRYNAAFNASDAERLAILRELFAGVGDGAVVRSPFHCEYGYNIRLGAGVFINFNCIILDVVAVTIGNGTQIGPAAQIYTADPSAAARSLSGAMYGSAVVRSSCLVSLLAMTPLSERAALSHITFPPARRCAATPPNRTEDPSRR